VEGNSVLREETTDSAEAAEISSIAILVEYAAKKRTIARPIPEAPPADMSENEESEIWGGTNRLPLRSFLSWASLP